MNETKRLNIKIKGQNHEAESKGLIKELANGLDLKGLIFHNDGVVEVIVEGEKAKVWHLLKKLTQAEINNIVHEIEFTLAESKEEFAELKVI